MTSDIIHAILSNIWVAFLVVLFFGGSIFVHELGHFLVARRRGAYVERFSIGFGPAIWSWRGRDGVEYRISWFPLGGYVLLPQLADLGAIEGKSTVEVDRSGRGERYVQRRRAADGTEIAVELPPVTYTTKMLVFVAGAFFNVLFAFALACILWRVGQPVATALSSTTIAEVSEHLETSDGKEVESPAVKAGLKAGDVIVAVDGAPVATFADMQERIALSSGWKQGERETVLTIRRLSQVFDVTVQPILSGPEKIRMVGIQTVAKLIVGKVIKGSGAEKAGLLPDDQIVAVNGKPVLTISQFGRSLSSAGTTPLDLSVLRKDQTIHASLAVPQGAKEFGDIGFSLTPGIVMLHPTPWEQIGDTVSRTFRPLVALVNPRSDIGLRQASGPIGMISSFVELSRLGIRWVLWFTIVVNVNLAILNLLPVPVLDGGQMVLATVARLRRRALPASIMVTLQSVFFVLIFALIGYITISSDIPRWWRDHMEDAPPKAKQPATAPASHAK